ncbi:MAG: DUF2158 domain-containing protein [Sulfobacillus sp.]
MSESSEAPRKFKPGDVVVLRSGGPKMTVMGYHHSSIIPAMLCSWFKDDTAMSEYFAETQVHMISPAPQ